MCQKLSIVLLAWLVALSDTVGARAQVATPAADLLFADLGLPALVLTATDDGLTLSQTEIPAGRYLLNLDNRSWDDDLLVEVVRFGLEPPPPTGEDTCIYGLPPRCFEWYTAVYLPGAVWAGSPWAIVDLRSGEYGFWGPGLLSPEPAARLIVTGDPSIRVAGPEPAGVRIAFVPSDAGSTAFRRGVAIRVEGALAAGPQFVRIANATDRPLIGVMEQDVLTLDPNATEDDMSRRVAVYGPLSPGVAQWVFVDLHAGLLNLHASVTTPINPANADTDSGWSDAAAAVVPVASG